MLSFRHFSLYFFTLLAAGFTSFPRAMAGLTPIRLTCEYRENPPVVDLAQPRLAWINQAVEGERGQLQTAWQIRVATSKDRLERPDMWDSKKVKSSQNNRVAYQGKPLASRQQYWWQVRVWDKNGKPSAWSEPAYWHMGIMAPESWQAQWIGAPWQGEEALPKPTDGPDGKLRQFPPPAPFLRKNFSLGKEVAKAVAYTTGLGYFELYLNGQKVGDDVLVPNNTNYGKRPDLVNENIPLQDNFREYKVMYLAYDLKPLLRSGENALGAVLGNGFYNPAKYWAGAYGSPRFLCQVHITYADGTEEVISSDTSWKASKGPILMDMLYYGERYDARLEMPGWDTPGFDDQGWENVVTRKAPEGKLVAHTPWPDKVTERFAPVRIEQKGAGHYFVDFGVEISGWVRLNNVTGPEGHQVDFKFNSNLYSGDNTYIFSGKGPASYAPRFNWFVFSGVDIYNWPGELKPEHLTAEMVNTYVEETAEFETSNQLFNDIHKIWKRSQVDNMHGGIASDCPHRERAGYTGDAQVACVTVIHNYNVQSFYHKWIQDMVGAQLVETGYVPNGAPWQPGCGGGVAWGAAISIMPWEFYLHYGARDILEETYMPMKEYIRYMQQWVDGEGIMFSQATGKDGKPLRWLNLGDWSAPGELVRDDMVHTFYFWRCADLTAKTARVLGKTEEARVYEALAEKTKKAFHQRFYQPTQRSYGHGGANIFALRMGVPQEVYPMVLETVKNSLKANQGHLDTGIFGTQFFFEILSEHGMHQEAYEAMNKKTMPSFGYWLELGATTTREGWDNRGSHNHPMFGGGIVWFYRKLAGMQADPQKPGYRHLIFQPQPVSDLSFVRYEQLTVLGKAGIVWKKENGALQLDLEVPVGSTATVHVPFEAGQSVSESGMPVAKVKSIVPKGEIPGYRVFEIGSGRYQFIVK
jgi:alpha-L-rhamnosidase